MIIAQISIVPIGTGSTSISNFIAEAVKILKRSGLNLMITPMGTVIEADDLERVFKVVKECHETLHNVGIKRIYTLIIVDDRRDVDRSMIDKIRSVEEKLSRSPKHHNDGDSHYRNANQHKEET